MKENRENLENYNKFILSRFFELEEHKNDTEDENFDFPHTIQTLYNGKKVFVEYYKSTPRHWFIVCDQEVFWIKLNRLDDPKLDVIYPQIKNFITRIKTWEKMWRWWRQFSFSYMLRWMKKRYSKFMSFEEPSE